MRQLPELDLFVPADKVESSTLEKNITERAKNFQVRRPRPDELFVDIDTPAQLVQYEQMRPLLELELGIFEFSRRPSKTPHHLHIILSGDVAFTHAERIALQLVLGGDPKHGLMALLSIIRPVVLYVPRQK